MKGKNKRKKSQFKQGHVPHNKGDPRNCEKMVHEPIKYKRLTVDVYNSITEESQDGAGVCTKDCDGQPCNVKYLRPRPNPPTILDELLKARSSTDSDFEWSMRYFDPESVEELWNTSITEHASTDPTCTGRLIHDKNSEKKWGICWKETLKCTECQYRSKEYNLYPEVDTGKPGRKPAAPNLGLQIGIAHTGIGNTGARNILMAAGIPAPALRSMQRNANYVNDVLVTTNKEDMKQRRAKLHEINEMKGLPYDAPIRVESDGRFNNPIASGSGDTPFQRGTQVQYIVCENVTKEKQVICLNSKNKLCQKGAIHQQKTGVPVSCPGGHPGHCSANISADKIIGDEYQWAAECLEDLSADNINVKYITTDSDSRASTAGIQLHKEGKLKIAPVSLKDTRHLSEAQRRALRNAAFTSDMFPGSNKAEKDHMKFRFAHDICDRCQAEFQQSFIQLDGNIRNMKLTLSYTTDAILKCCQGDHSDCINYSYVCSNKKDTECTVWSTCYIDKEYNVQCEDSDLQILKKCIEMRLGKKAIDDTRFSTNTQKVESVNRALSYRNPKNLTLSRNVYGRVHSAILSVNCGPGESVVKECQAVGVPVCDPRIVQQLKQVQSRKAYWRRYAMTPLCKRRRCTRRLAKYRLYDNKKSENTYKKNMTGPTIKVSAKKNVVHDEHPYSLRHSKRHIADHGYNKVNQID